MQYLSTANIDIFICPFVYCAFLVAMATRVWKTFATDVGQNATAEASYACARALDLYSLTIFCRCIHTLKGSTRKETKVVVES